MLRGALHIHSTWSDGEFTLSELRHILVGAGCRFACVTDHAVRAVDRTLPVVLARSDYNHDVAAAAHLRPDRRLRQP